MNLVSTLPTLRDSITPFIEMKLVMPSQTPTTPVFSGWNDLSSIVENKHFAEFTARDSGEICFHQDII